MLNQERCLWQSLIAVVLPQAWDCSAWVRTYGLFLEERLECFKILKYDIEAERIPRPAQGEDNKGYSRTRDLDSEQLLEQLPSLQQLLYRLMGCRPEGAAVGNYVIQYALALVLKESFKIYCAVNDGIINLIDKFFEMPRHEAIKALDIYKRAGQQAGSLSDFYEVCKGLELARNFQFLVLREVLQSTIYEVDLDRILQSIHVYLQDLGMEEVRRAGADDKPLCVLKTVLHELVKLCGTAIKGHLSMVPIDMEPPPIILAYIDLNLQTLATARMLTSTGPVGQTHWGDSMANNPVPYTHSADAQLKV